MNFNSHLNQDTYRPVQVTYAVYLLYAFLVTNLLIYLIRTIAFFAVELALIYQRSIS